MARKSGVVRQPEGDGRRPADGASFSIDALPIGTYGDADHYVTVNTSSSPAGYDVEGAEAAVILGGRRTIEATQPLILLEISDKALRAQGSGARALIDTLRRDLDYQIGIFSAKSGRIELLGDGEDLSSNVLAMPRDRVSEIAGR